MAPQSGRGDDAIVTDGELALLFVQMCLFKLPDFPGAQGPAEEKGTDV